MAPQCWGPLWVKTRIIIHYYFEKPLYLVYCNVSKLFKLCNVGITVHYYISLCLFLFRIVFVQKCSKHIRYFGKCLNYKKVPYRLFCVWFFCAFNCLF